jgi:predicted dehydrogenase
MSPQDSKTIRIGILGAARIAPMALVQPAGKTDGVTVRAVAARDRQRAAAFAKRHGIPTVHGSYGDLISDPEIDVIYNPLPNGLHGFWSVRALEAGKHVLCEKPIAANADEARDMVDAAARCGRRLIEAFHYRYHPLVERVREIIESGEIGAVRRYEASFIVPIVRGGDIRYRFELAGGATMDLGCYPIHFLRTLAGAEPVVKRASAVEAPADIDRSMDATMEFPGGVAARVECSMWSPKILRVGASIEGEKGRIDVLNFVGPQVYNSVKVRTASAARRERIKGPATYTAQLRAVVAALRDDTPLPTEGDDSIFNMRVIDAIYDAAGLPRRAPSAP